MKGENKMELPIFCTCIKCGDSFPGILIEYQCRCGNIWCSKKCAEEDGLINNSCGICRNEIVLTESSLGKRLCKDFGDYNYSVSGGRNCQMCHCRDRILYDKCEIERNKNIENSKYKTKIIKYIKNDNIFKRIIKKWF